MTLHNGETLLFLIILRYCEFCTPYNGRDKFFVKAKFIQIIQHCRFIQVAPRLFRVLSFMTRLVFDPNLLVN